MKVKESLNVTSNETLPPPKTSPLEDDELVEEESIEVSKTKPIGNDLQDISLENNQLVNIKESKTHPLKNVIEYVSDQLGIHSGGGGWIMDNGKDLVQNGVGGGKVCKVVSGLQTLS
nr:hypothetical protein CTI12_AA182560 [Tanacetum cinerariifolium]